MVHGCQRLIKERHFCVQGNHLIYVILRYYGISVWYAFKISLDVFSNSADLVISANLHSVIPIEQSGSKWGKHLQGQRHIVVGSGQKHHLKLLENFLIFYT